MRSTTSVAEFDGVSIALDTVMMSSFLSMEWMSNMMSCILWMSHIILYMSIILCVHIQNICIYIYTQYISNIYIYTYCFFIYMNRMFMMGCLQLSRFMDRAALTGGVGAGSSFAIGWHLLRLLDSSPGPLTPHYSDLCLGVATTNWWDISWFSLILGIVIGLFLGPVVEALVTIRIWIYHCIVRRSGISLAGEPRPLHKVTSNCWWNSGLATWKERSHFWGKRLWGWLESWFCWGGPRRISLIVRVLWLRVWILPYECQGPQLLTRWYLSQQQIQFDRQELPLSLSLGLSEKGSVSRSVCGLAEDWWEITGGHQDETGCISAVGCGLLLATLLGKIAIQWSSAIHSTPARSWSSVVRAVVKAYSSDCLRKEKQNWWCPWQAWSGLTRLDC